MGKILRGKKYEESDANDKIKVAIKSVILVGVIKKSSTEGDSGLTRWANKDVSDVIADLLKLKLVTNLEGHEASELFAGPKLKEFLRDKINDSEYRSILVDGLADLGLRSLAQVRAH